MNIVVLLKQVHDPNIPRAFLGIAGDSKSLLLPASSRPILNGYDANALEASIKLRERCGGTATPLSVGSGTRKEGVRRAIGMGSDKAVRLAGASRPAVAGHA